MSHMRWAWLLPVSDRSLKNRGKQLRNATMLSVRDKREANKAW